MSTHLERRLSRLERQIAPEIAPDEQDPRLVEFCVAFGVPAEKVPYGVSVEVYTAKLAKECQGRCIEPVRLPAG